MNNTPKTELLLEVASDALKTYAESLNLDINQPHDRAKIQKDLVATIEAYLEVNK
jgi:hypothetical protein